MEVVNLSDSRSIAEVYVGEIRDTSIQVDRMRFRRNMERIAAFMGMEISKRLSYSKQNIQTPLGIAEGQQLSDQPVIATILRAGLPMHNGLLSVFDNAGSAFVSAYRKHSKSGDFEIRIEYISCPDLEGKVLIMTDPMLATGASMVLALEELCKIGKPSSIHLCSAISSSEGIEYLRHNFGDCTLWTGAIDDELTARGYIVPGLGDAGDLCFGEKLQQ